MEGSFYRSNTQSDSKLRRLDYLDIFLLVCDYQGPDFDDISSFFPCEIDYAIKCINLGYGAQAPKIFIL